MVRDGVNGLLIPTRDPEALALAISTLIENPLLRARMGACGREIVVNEFSSERIVQEYLALFRRVLEPSASAVVGPLSIGNIDRPGTDLSLN
jgi:glycosyltransferase involved in cell wall biosynthesis